MTRTRHLVQLISFLAFLAAGALLLGACGPLEFGLEPTPGGPAVMTVVVTREVTAAPPTPTPRPTRPPTAVPTALPTLTPRPTTAPSPTPCAHARIGGKVCAAGRQVTISSCCPEWAVHTNADVQGNFEFAALTVGTFTVSDGRRSQTVTLETCYSEAVVDLCLPAPTPGPTCPPEAVQIAITRVEVRDYRVTISGQAPWSCAPPRLAWNWGDGWSDTQDLPAAHTYANGGTYTVRLSASNDTGATAAWSARVVVGPYVGPMVRVPAGDFVMGCDAANPAEVCDANAQPVHTVYLDAYFIDLYEVTNGRYRACVQAGGCAEPPVWRSARRSLYYNYPVYDDYPVLHVSWQDAADYCAWAGKRLPTEAEWEKAARGTAGDRAFPWGNEAPDCARVNFKGAAGYCVGDTARVGHPAGSSPYGLQDMAGSVWEWVSDRYGEGYYGVSPARNPTGPAEGTERVVRGGSWFEEARWVHATARVGDLPTARYDRLGFRCAWGE